MEDIEPIPPDDSKLFCQQRLDAISKKLDSNIRDSGIKKILHAQFYEELTFPHQEELTLEQIIKKYGNVLTEQELDKLKQLIKPNEKD